MMLRTIPRKERARNIIVCNLNYLAEKSVRCKCRTCPHGIGVEECQKCDEWWWERARLFFSDTVIRRLRGLYTPAKIEEMGHVAAHEGVKICKKNTGASVNDIRIAKEIYVETRRLLESCDKSEEI